MSILQPASCSFLTIACNGATSLPVQCGGSNECVLLLSRRRARALMHRCGIQFRASAPYKRDVDHRQCDIYARLKKDTLSLHHERRLAENSARESSA